MKLFFVVINLIIILFITGCGGSSGNNNGQSSTNVSGHVVANYIKDAEVIAKDDSNNTIAKVKTDKDGKYNINIGQYKGSISLEVTGGTYLDEYTNKMMNLDIPLRATGIIDNNKNTINITPFTELAYREIKKVGFEKQNIKNINQSISQSFSDDYSNIDIIKTIPSTITDDKLTNEKSKYYGLLLASLSANGDLNSTLLEMENNLAFQNNEMIIDGIDDIIGNNLEKLINMTKEKGLLDKMINLFNKKVTITPNFDRFTNQKDVSFLIKGRGVKSYKYSLDGQKYSKRYKINEPIELKDLEEGKHTISIMVKSKKGYWSRSKDIITYTWENDYTTPIVSIDKAEGKYFKPLNVTLKSDENSTIYYTTDGSTPLKGESNTFSSNTKANIFISEPLTLKYYAIDRAGNITDIESLKYNLPDKYAPVVKLISPLHKSISYDTKPQIQFELKDVNGIDYDTLELIIDGTNVTNDITILNNTILYTPNTPFGDKKISISLKVSDTFGTIVNKSYSFTVDSTPFNISASHDSGHYYNAFYFRLIGNRPSKIYYTLDKSTPQKDGANTKVADSPIENIRVFKNTHVKYFAQDNYGNTTDIKSSEFIFDKQAPQIISSNILNDDYINSLKPKFLINFSDDLSGVDTSRVDFKVNGFSKINTAIITDKTLEYIPQFDLNEDINTMELLLVDNVGNSRYYLYNFRLDITNPISNISHNTDLYNKDINISISSNEPSYIYYTLDGTQPILDEVNKKPLPLSLDINQTTTLKYIVEDLSKKLRRFKRIYIHNR